MSDSEDRRSAGIMRREMETQRLPCRLCYEWFWGKVEEFWMQGNRDAVEAVRKEYDLWPKPSTESSGSVNVPSASGGNTEGTLSEENQDLLSALNVASSFTGPGVTLNEAAFSTFVRDKKHWNVQYKVSLMNGEQKEETIIRFLGGFPHHVKYAQYHNVGNGYWKVDAEVPVG